MYIDAAAAEPAFAILQIIAPQTDENIVELRRQTLLCHGSIEILTPDRQRFGVIEPEIVLVFPAQPAFFGQSPELAGSHQQSSGEDVGLDEIGAGSIGIEQIFMHRDVLDRRFPARLQIVGYAIHESRPILPAQRLHHLHTDNGIVLPRNIAVVTFSEIGIACARLALVAREGELFVGKADRINLYPCHCRGIGQHAPAAANLQQTVAGLHLHPVQHGGDLRELRVVEFAEHLLHLAGRASRAEHGAGINHALTQPFTVEIVAEIVMGVDVPGRSRARIAVEPMGKPQGEPPRTAGPAGITQRFAIGDEQGEQGNHVVGLPFAGCPGLIPADRTCRGEAHQRTPVVQSDSNDKPRVAPAQHPRGSIGQMPVDRAFLDSLVEPVKDTVKSWRKRAGEPAGPTGEASAAAEQRLRACSPHAPVFLRNLVRPDHAASYGLRPAREQDGSLLKSSLAVNRPSSLDRPATPAHALPGAR